MTNEPLLRNNENIETGSRPGGSLEARSER